MGSFKAIHARAAKRKGGDAALAALLPKPADAKSLARLPDSRVLAEMSKRIFAAGFVWPVIEHKWPGFEKAFLGFEPQALAFQADEFLGGPRRRCADRAQPAKNQGRAPQCGVRSGGFP